MKISFKALGVLSLALAPLFGGAPIDVHKQIDSHFDKYTYNIEEQTYLKISSNVDDIVIQNIELNRGNCKSEIHSNTSLKSYESKRKNIVLQIENMKEKMKREETQTYDGSEIRMYMEQTKDTIKTNENFQKQLSAINTFDELVDRINNDTASPRFPDLDLDSGTDSTNDYDGNGPKGPEDKKIYSLRLFEEHLKYFFATDFSDDERGREFINDITSRIKPICDNTNIYTSRSFVTGSCTDKYYLDDYVKSVVGDEDYNKLTSRDFWETKEWSKEEIDKFKQDSDPLYQKIQKKILTAYLQEYKDFTLNQSNAILKEARTELSKLRKIYQQEQQKYQKEHQQKIQQKQQESLKEQKELTQKLAQVEQKIKRMKEQGNTIEIPLKFGEVFKTRACSNLKEAKIKTNKGTYTFSF
ncbi:hypothetical protein DD780_06200 [Helicobacter pylori]|uniref:hypothetical protein n=1 Tax=Helicobacter pylori TaxID=210 RepID=UPI000EB3F8A0|nr:hypothetical protein [Helicobacter pylori]RKV45318.1 hypothetical protein DD780_06200 [Helicobacter pylori]